MRFRRSRVTFFVASPVFTFLFYIKATSKEFFVFRCVSLYKYDLIPESESLVKRTTATSVAVANAPFTETESRNVLYIYILYL